MIPQLEAKILHSNEHADVGRYTYGTPKFLPFISSEKVSIGSFCSIADDVTFIMGGNHYQRRETTYPLNLLFDDITELPWHEYSKGKITIGSDVWIGYGCTILSGVTIGHGAVIGAGSVVREDVPDYNKVIGNPSKVTGQRFSDSRIKELLEMKWWNWELERIKAESIRLLGN